MGLLRNEFYADGRACDCFLNPLDVTEIHVIRGRNRRKIEAVSVASRLQFGNVAKWLFIPFKDQKRHTSIIIVERLPSLP